MTLKSIELIGFKSFGKKSLLTFTTPVTAIVGPNGSGKSNIVEAIRFVLGEQSMKSLRSKAGVDLIFKGSKGIPQANRASVTIVFDNSKKNFSFTNSGLGLSLDYDEIVISREVFTDGSNRYSINNTEVRLKDVVDLLASVNIGSSGHHIISQGEADRVLNATNKDRKAMIEDALGLRIYQYRIKDSERKLEKTILNMKEVESIRREIAPHLKFLKKQVKVIERVKNMHEELRTFYKTYLSIESTYIKKENLRLENLRSDIDSKMVSLDEKINKIKENKEEEKESKYSIEIREQELKLNELRIEKDKLSRSIGRIEGILESLKHQAEKTVEKEEKVISAKELEVVINEVQSKINEALSMKEMPEIIHILNTIKEKINSLYNKTEDRKVEPNLDIQKEYEDMKSEQDKINQSIANLSEKESSVLKTISDLRKKDREEQESLREAERVLYELLNEKNKLVSSSHSLKFQEEKLVLIKKSFDEELMEAAPLIGRDAVDFSRVPFEGEINRQEQEDLHHKIERIKIKLEDMGGNDNSEIMKEYEDTTERDAFLEKELVDLKDSIDSLQVLIKELKETLNKEFKVGIDKINSQFQEFFVAMFGGGRASLSLTMEHKRNRKTEKDELGELIEKEDTEESELSFERGIEIDISLPHKKVKDLNMLSGGERSLTSIALLFAISQVNPPPFLVLDETDAALDEANSRKYGDMIKNLSEYSELIIVTHNRETMSRAGVLYGVTMSSLGVSKFLSIELEDAKTYAK